MTATFDPFVRDDRKCKNCGRETCTDIDCGSPKGGLRYNAGKVRMSLISPFAAEGLAAILTYGEKKYAAWNWAKGLKYSQTIDSLERHLAAFKKGEDLDPESGLPHIDHVAANVMFLSHFQKCDHYDDGGFDDRFKAMAGK